MKRVTHLFLFAIMLRIWFYDQSYCDFSNAKNMTLQSGIYVGTFGGMRSSPFMVVRLDDGTLGHICANGIAKTEWVEVKIERNK